MKDFLKNSLNWDRPDFPALIKFILQLSSYAATVAVTIYFAPSVDQHFEAENRKTAFYTSTINAFNTDTKKVLGDITSYLDYSGNTKKTDELRIQIRQNITKLHWRRIEFGLVYHDARMNNLLEKYANSLTDLNNILSSDDIRHDEISSAIGEFGLISAKIIQYLAEKAGI